MKTQIDAVAETMRRNGGYATLRYLYEHVLEVEDVRWTTKTPFASMRRIVQKSDLFFKVKPGLWALREYRGQLPQDIQGMMQNPDDRSVRGAELSHSYYQGIALELGHLKGHQTYVPAQDGNRLCAGRPLKQIADTTRIPEFTYDRVLRSARMIDAIWFNSHGFPDSVIEIEHTTDFRGAFEKFSELIDFRVHMVAVGHPARRRQFEDVIGRTVYEPLRSRVRYMNYENLAALHASTMTLAEAEGRCRPV
jgi:hypothetical protein